MIDRLKKNRLPFGLLDDEMKEAFKEFTNTTDKIEFYTLVGWEKVIPGWFQHLVYRLSPDYEEPRKRWFFNTITHTIRSTDGEDINTWPALIDKEIVIEVQECDLPYLEKPEQTPEMKSEGVEWGFRKVENGDEYISLTAGKIVFTSSSASDEIDGYDAIQNLFGYRWCKPSKTWRWEETARWQTPDGKWYRIQYKVED